MDGSAAKDRPQHLVALYKDALARMHYRTVTRHLPLALARGLYPIVIVVVLPAPAIAELLVFARFADLMFFSDRDRGCVGDDASAILAAGKIAGRGHQPVHLQVHGT
jgi:hypothetical protein